MNHFAEELRALIEATENEEIRCRGYLQHVRRLLFREAVLEYTYVETEYIVHTGRSDYVISARVRDETGLEYVKAYVWELKAPQCFMFEHDTENRVKPSAELSDAQNKLLHYFDEEKGSSDFHATFGVVHPDHVKLGGIIIGSERTRVHGDYTEDKKRVLFEKARRIQDTYLYQAHGIRLVSWETVLDQLKPPHSVGETRQIPAAGPLPVSPRPDVTKVESRP